MRKWITIGCGCGVLLGVLGLWLLEDESPETPPTTRGVVREPLAELGSIPEEIPVAPGAVEPERQRRLRLAVEECEDCPDMKRDSVDIGDGVDIGACIDLLQEAASNGEPHPDTSHLEGCLNMSPLHIVTNVQDLRSLLEAGADPNVRDHVGRTPLHRLVFDQGTPEMISALLEAGADPDLLDDRGRSVLTLLQMRPNRARMQYTMFRATSEIQAEEQGLTLEAFLARRPDRKALMGNYSPDDSDIVRMSIDILKAGRMGRQMREMMSSVR